MTPRQAETVYNRFNQVLSEAESAIDTARRNVGRRNGFYSTAPQLSEARLKLQAALDMLPEVEVASVVLG